MDALEQLRAALSSIPELNSRAADDSEDELQTALEYSRTLRKLGIQSSRQFREVENRLATLSELKESAQRERERALSAESDFDKAVRLMVDQLDVWKRVADLMSGREGMQEWANQLHSARQAALHTFEAVGLTAVGRPGEPFDPERHDPVDSTVGSDARVETIAVEGFALKGRVIRRAQVTLVARENS